MYCTVQMAEQNAKGTPDVMDTGILDLPDSEEEEAGAGADAASNTASNAGGVREATTSPPQGAAEEPPPPTATPKSRIKESTVSQNPTETMQKDGKVNSGSVTDISKKMKKTRIVSYAEGGGGGQ
jgi:outer membrane biosynthesis protein TonB